MKILMTALMALTFFSGVAQAEVKVGYVDVQRAILEAEEGKARYKELETLKNKRQKEIDAMKSELMKLNQELQQKAAVLKEDVLRQKAMLLRQKQEALMQKGQQWQVELAGAEAQMLQAFTPRIEKVLKKLSESGGYTMIFQKAALAWAPPHLDITNEVIRQLNDSSGKGKKKRKKGKK